MKIKYIIREILLTQSVSKAITMSIKYLQCEEK